MFYLVTDHENQSKSKRVEQEIVDSGVSHDLHAIAVCDKCVLRGGRK